MEIVKFSKSSIDRIKQKIEKSKKETEETCVILIDTSGSMSEKHGKMTKINAAKRAIYKILETKHKVSYGLVSFDTNARLISEPTLSYGLLREAVETMSPNGLTNMLEGLKVAIDSFLDYPPCKKRIVLLSDGEPNLCTKDEIFQEVRKCVSKEIIIDTIAFGDRCDEEFLKKISLMTSGIFQKARSSEELINVFKSLKYEIRYLTYEENDNERV